ncbi:AAA family ATPase [Corallococcus terminator]|uniref:OLD family endonuclease n=1 Tax=Corallococcus terminator TaxID=2316733 RepID=A0A3A8JBJ8_9BACT|nr:AAA family ATPase [Corallococcus terminator]RKG92438.1 OLD family endonuclease [Corallococcus terminator]
MRLDRVVIRNFKSIKSIDLQVPQKDEHRQGSADFLSIVGENNAGKSSIMEAIRLACTAASKAGLDQFPGIDPGNGPIEMELAFDQLNENDRNSPAVAGNTFTEDGREKYRLKRIWKTPGAASENSSYNPNRPPTVHLTGWTGKKTLKTLLEADERWKPILELVTKENSGPRPPIDMLIQAAKKLDSPLLETHPQEPWAPYQGSSASHLEAILPSVIYVPALRETSEEADVGMKQSSIRKIVNSLFEQQLAGHERVIRFRSAAIELQDLFATDGKHRIVTSIEEQITAKFKELINIGAELKFSAPDVMSDLANSTEFRVLDGGLSTTPDNQGHGAQRSIVLALLQMYAEQLRKSTAREQHPMLFLIEEPEIYLHPAMCRRMRDTLLKISRSGAGQVICTTHSPVFLDLADRHDGIVILRKKAAAPVATQRTRDVFDQTEGDKEQRARLRMLLTFDPAVNEAFFSEQVCLVEGDCEIAAVEAVARRLEKEGSISWSKYLLARRMVTLINCRGKWTIPAFQKVLRAFDINYRVIYDLDVGAQANQANSQINNLLSGNDQSLPHDPNFEEFIFGKHWRSDKPWLATKTINEAPQLNPRLIAFFEFAIGQSISDLKPDAVPPAPEHTDAPQLRRPHRRNLRGKLKELKVPAQVIQSARRVEQLFRVAAGPNFATRPDSDSPLQQLEGTKIDAFAIVTGTSMADTLHDNDIVALKFLDKVFLEPVHSTDLPFNAAIPSLIENDGIYVLAANDDIDQKSYTMKRVRISTRTGGAWLGNISADNPDTNWGDRGHFEIRKTDRVHFAAQVIGVVRRDELEGFSPEALGLTTISMEQETAFEED